jgi:dipeptidyl aminopeptidase/acylaminoacyl peptidase
MSFPRLLLFAAFISVCFNSFSQSNELPPLISREIFFGTPEISGAQLSPDGKFTSFIKPYNGIANIWVKASTAPFTDARPVTADSTRPLKNYFWSRDSRYILFIKDNGGDENFNLFAVDLTSPSGGQIPPARDLTRLTGVIVYFYAFPYADPDAIFIGLNDRDPSWHDLYKLKISTGEKTLVHLNSAQARITNWLFDWDDKLRLATRSNEDGTSDILRVEKDSFHLVYSTGSYESTTPYAFDLKNEQVYLLTNKGDATNLMQLTLFDPVRLTEKKVESDPLNRVDLVEVVFSEVTREILYTSYKDSKFRRYWKDKELEKDIATIQKSLPGTEFELLSATADENKWLFTIYSDTNPGVVYFFDRKTKRLELQYQLRPLIPMRDLAAMQPISYPSSDGLEIPAYIILPKNIESKNLPLIVIPHGGPWSRTSWNYNSTAQFLANRGYAVLMPNFRGSTGYGKNFTNAGNKEWGGKMQDDISWGVKYLVTKGIADPKRVGIMGGSYGGYATLAGVAFTPELYKAAVSVVGPSSLLSFINTIPPYWEVYRTMFHLRLGNPNIPAEKTLLEKRSPLNSVEKIITPLLVAHGANDPRVKKAESEQLVKALRDRNFPVEYIVAPDEGHGFAKPVNNMALLAAAEKFFAKWLGGRYQESMTPEVSKRLTEITIDIRTLK